MCSATVQPWLSDEAALRWYHSGICVGIYCPTTTANGFIHLESTVEHATEYTG